MPQKLEFYDTKKGKPFKSTDYSVKNIRTPSGMRKQAIAKAPGGNPAYRFVPNSFKK